MNELRHQCSFCTNTVPYSELTNWTEIRITKGISVEYTYMCPICEEREDILND